MLSASEGVRQWAANDKGSGKIGVKNEMIITKATSRGGTAKLVNITSITL